ncbi:MAG: antibiotic biosynthesis monooxygenase [Desulfurococcales archaeon]|nr:antibiotic biosynthesis monooxygenase [Desulfurococcales archaeon]
MDSIKVPCNSIVRIWTGETPLEKADEYEKFLAERAIPDYRSVSGNLGVVIMRRDLDNRSRFTILTFWESLEAIKSFAGEDYEKAKYYPEDKEYLLDFPEHVEHYKITACSQS